MSARRPTAVAPSPLPDRAELAEYAAQDELEIKARGRRVFYRAVSVACATHSAPVGVPCFVIPNPDEPGVGQGIGFGPTQDRPLVCPRRAQFAASLASV